MHYLKSDSHNHDTPTPSLPPTHRELFTDKADFMTCETMSAKVTNREGEEGGGKMDRMGTIGQPTTPLPKNNNFYFIKTV